MPPGRVAQFLPLKTPRRKRIILYMCTNHDPKRPPADRDGGRPPRQHDKHQRHRETGPDRRDEDVPYWVPSGTTWQLMPSGVRRAVSQVLSPAYRRFVLDAPGELERSIGLTLVHLMWLEICDQVRLADAAADETSLTAVLSDPTALIGRHLHLAASKCQTAELLVKLRMVCEAFERPPAAVLPAAALPAPAQTLDVPAEAAKELDTNDFPTCSPVPRWGGSSTATPTVDVPAEAANDGPPVCGPPIHGGANSKMNVGTRTVYGPSPPQAVLALAFTPGRTG